MLGDKFNHADAVETFTYASGRVLTGYEERTENPSPDKRVGVAVGGADSATPSSASSLSSAGRMIWSALTPILRTVATT